MKDNKPRRRRRGRTSSGNTYVEQYHERTKGQPGLRPIKPRRPESKIKAAYEDLEKDRETRTDGVSEGRMMPKYRGCVREDRPPWVVSRARQLAATMRRAS